MRTFLLGLLLVGVTAVWADEPSLSDDVGQVGLKAIPGYALGDGDDVFADLAVFDVDAGGGDLGSISFFAFNTDAPAALKSHLIGRYTNELGAIHGDLAGAMNVEGTTWYRVRLADTNEWYRYDDGLDAIVLYMQPIAVSTRDALTFLAAFDAANSE